jgi:hypothetical protein
MNIANITAESLSKALGADVPDVYVVLAKHSVMGMDHAAISEVLGVTPGDIKEVEDDELYQRVRTQIGAIYADNQTNRVFGWDGIEEIAIQKLAERIPFEKDSDFLLRVAAVANKAQRRGAKDVGVLDPTRAGKTAVTLTQRMVQRMIGGGTQVVERQLSIHDGSMQRVSFGEVDDLLGVSMKPVAPVVRDITTRDGDLWDELGEELENQI